LLTVLESWLNSVLRVLVGTAGSHTASQFSLAAGVRQEGILFSLLFAKFIDTIFDIVKNTYR